MAWRQTKQLQQTSSCAVILNSRGVNRLSQTVVCALGQQLWNPVNSAKLLVICHAETSVCLVIKLGNQGNYVKGNIKLYLYSFRTRHRNISRDHLDQVIRNYFMFPGLNSKIEVIVLFDLNYGIVSRLTFELPQLYKFLKLLLKHINFHWCLIFLVSMSFYLEPYPFFSRTFIQFLYSVQHIDQLWLFFKCAI